MRLAERLRGENKEREKALIGALREKRFVQAFLQDQIEWLDVIMLVDKTLAEGSEKIIAKLQYLLEQSQKENR